VKPLTPELQRSIDCYVGCVAGASPKEEYLRLMREAGFREVEVLSESRYTVGLENLPEASAELAAYDAVASVKVRAVKPA
jgi:hypothetical protein